MARRSTNKKAREKKKLLEEGYKECYYCNKLVKPKAIKCPHCGKWYSSGKQVIAVALAFIIILSTIGAYYLLGDSHNIYVPPADLPTVLSTTPTGITVSTSTYISVTFNKEMNKPSVESALSITPSIPGSSSWTGNTLRYAPSGSLIEGTYYTVTIGNGAVDLDGNHLDCDVYTWRFTTEGGTTTNTRRDIGSGDNVFWSAFTNHPSWATADVLSKPVLILTHTEGCAPCETMIVTCSDLSETYSGQITYYDLLSGTDEPQATECFAAYDTMPPSYVPLTTILTKGPDNQIIWHSWEGIVEKAVLSSWIEDALSYHEDY